MFSENTQLDHDFFSYINRASHASNVNQQIQEYLNNPKGMNQIMDNVANDASRDMEINSKILKEDYKSNKVLSKEFKEDNRRMVEMQIRLIRDHLKQLYGDSPKSSTFKDLITVIYYIQCMSRSDRNFIPFNVEAPELRSLFNNY